MATKYSEPSESDDSDMDDKPTSSQVVLLATLPSSDCILSTHSMPRRILEITKTITVTEVVRGTSSDKGACEVTVTNVESGTDHPVSIRISHLHEDYNDEDPSIYSIEKGRRSLSIPSYINQEYSNTYISSNSKEKKKTSKDTTMSRSMDNVIDIEFSHPVKEAKEEKRRFAAYIRRDEDKSRDYKSFFDDYQTSSSYVPSTSYDKKEKKEEEDESDGSMIEYNQQSNSEQNQYLTRVEMNSDDQKEQVENTMTSSDDDLHYSPPNGLSVSQICVNDVNHRYIVTSMAHSPSTKKDSVMTENELDDTNISMESTQKDPDYVIESSSYIVVSRNEIKEPMSRNSSFNTMMTECQPGTSTDYTIHPTTPTTVDDKHQEEIIYTPSKWKENVQMDSPEEKKIKDIHQPIAPLRTKKKSSMKTTKEEETNGAEHELVKKKKEDTDSNRSMTSSLRKRITADKLEYQEQLKENNQEEKPPIPSRRKTKDTSQILTYNTTITAAEKMKEEKIITNTDELNQTHIEINIVGPEENNKNTDGKRRVGENLELEIVFMKKEDDERIDKSISPPPKPPRNQKSTEDEQIIIMDRPKQCDIPLTPPINSSTPITSLERKHRSNSQDSGNTLDENNQHKQKTSDSVHREIEEMATGRSSPSRNTPTTPIVVVNQSRKGSVELLEAGHRTRRKSTVTDIDWFAAFNMKDPTTPKSPRSPLPIDMLKEADYSVFEKKRRASMPVVNSSIPPSIISIDEIFKCSANQTERKKCECNACHQKPHSSDSSSIPSSIVRRRHTVSESIPLDPLYSTPPVKIDVEDIFNPSQNKTTPEILTEGVSNLIEKNENISNDRVNDEEIINIEQRLPESVISMDDVFGIIDKKEKENEKNKNNMSSMARMKQMKESRSAEKMNRKTKLTTVYSVPETADDQYYKERRGEDENITNIEREEQRPTGERPMIIKRNISMEEELNIGNKTISDLELKKDKPSDWKEVNSSVMTTSTTTITTTSQGETLEVKHPEERRPSFPEIITIADVHNNYEDSNYVSVMETQKIPSEEVDEEEISIDTILKKEDEKEKTSNDWVEMLVKGEIREEDGINKKKYYTETIAVEKNISSEATGKEWKNTKKNDEMSNSLDNVKDIFEEKKTDDDDESVDINDTKKNVEETNENDWITNLLEQDAPEITEEEKRKIKYYQEIPIEKNLQEEIKQNWKKKKQIETEETPEEDEFVERTDWIQSLIQEEENGKMEEKASWNNSIDEIFIPQKDNEIEYKELQYPRTTVMIIEDVKNDSSPRVSSSFDKDYFAALLTKYHSDSIEIKTEKDDLTDDLIDKKSVEVRNEKEEKNDLLTQVFDCSICVAASNTKEKCQCSACNIDELTPYDIEQRRKKQIEKTKQIEASQEMKNLSMEHSIQSDITVEDIFCQKSKEKDCKPIQSNVLITTEKEDTNDDDEISLDRILPHPSPPHESTPSPHAPSTHAPSTHVHAPSPLPPSDPLPPIPSSTTSIDESSLNNRYESRQYETRIYRENVILRRKKEDHQDQPRVISSLSVTLSDCTDPNPESNISPREISMDEIFSSINRDSIIYRKSLDEEEEEIEQIPSTSHTYYNEIQSQHEECVKGNEMNMDEILKREDSPERRYSLKHEASSSSSDKESSSRDNSATTSPSSHRPLREFLSEHPLNLKQSMEDSMTEEEENTSKDDYLIYSGRRRGSLALEGRPVKDLCTSDTPIIPIITEWQKDNVLSTVQEIGSESTVSSTVPPASVSHVDDDIMSQVFNDQSIGRQISEKRMDDSVKKKNFDEDYIDCPDAFKELIERKHEQRLSRKHLDEYYDDPYDSPSEELDVVDFVDDILNQSMDEAAFFSASHNKQTISLTDTSVDRKRSNQQNEDITKDDGYDHYYGLKDKPEGSNNKKIEDEKRENSQTYPTSSNMAIDPGYLLNSNGIMNDTQTSSEGDADDYFLKLVFSDKKTGEEQIAMLDKIDRSNQEEEISEERTTTNNITNTTIITSMETEVKAADEEILEIEVNSDFYIVKGHYSMIINKIDPLGQMLAQIQEGTGQPVSLDFTVTSRLRKALYNCLKDKILKKSSTGNEVSLRALEMLNDEDLTHKVYSDMSLNKFHPVNNSEGNINLCTAENNLCWDLVSAQFPRGGDVSSLVTEKHIGHYPPAGGHQSTKTVVKNYFHQVCGAMIPESEMVILPSINTSYDLVSFSLFEADDVILTATPMYPSIIDKCKERAQCRVEGVQLDLTNPTLIVEDYQKAVDKYSREGVSVCGIILINPHNPTGIVFPPDDVIRLCNWASKHNMHVIVDESFSNCVYGSSSFSSFLTYKDQLDKPNMTVFLWSLSKDFGLPGVKLGVVSSTNRLLLSSISRLELLFPVSALAHDFAIQLLQDHEFVKFFHSTKVSRLRCHYEFTKRNLSTLGLPFIPATAGVFVLVDFSKKLESLTVSEEISLWKDLCSHRVFLIPGTQMKNEMIGWMRIVFACTPQELEEGFHRLFRFFDVNTNSIGRIDYTAVPSTDSSVWMHNQNLETI